MEMGRACIKSTAWEAYADVGQLPRSDWTPPPEGKREVLLVQDVHDRVPPRSEKKEDGLYEVALDGLTRAAFCAARAPSWTPSCSSARRRRAASRGSGP